MDTTDINIILKKLEDHENRIGLLEGKPRASLPVGGQQKEITLVELIRGQKFSSGQQKVTAIVGYFEKIAKKNNISQNDIRNEWHQSKMEGKYDSKFMERAISKDGLVRETKGVLDLSQTGEKFFEELINKNNGKDKKGTEQ